MQEPNGMDSFHSMALHCVRQKILMIKPRAENMTIARVRVNLAKQVFQIHGVTRNESVKAHKRLRWS